MTPHHPGEPAGNALRTRLAAAEPKSLRTFTPSQAAIVKSAGVFHWTADGRRLYDFTSGVLVSNLGHNPTGWMRRFAGYMGWPAGGFGQADGFTPAAPLTAYNAVTPAEVDASARLLKFLRTFPGGGRMEQVMWAASGSEAIHKAVWAALSRDKARPIILATRNGFHGKKGFANAVTGSEADAERDPRVRFISFPTAECRDVSERDRPFDPAPYRRELDGLLHQFGRKIGTLITEPYLGGGGSYHPPKAYLQLLQQFCRENDVVFILDEVQANFGRTGCVFAFETYGLEPDLVVLGKGLGNGVPVAAAVGRADLFAPLDYGEASDTWSANPLSSAAVLATLDEFEARDVVGGMRAASAAIEAGLVGLKEFPFVAHVRGEKGGMVWGVETRDHAGRSAPEWANAFVLACYAAAGGDGVHLLGPLSKKVVRVSPPLVITADEARAAVVLMADAAARLATAPDRVV
ncbi:MAG: aspartate aminotransferase family protein [Isosphaera sp.]|nr:aspartate aminotransferase family protein [Isosphaera sp.]